jgi:hypothetical protein
MALGARDGVPLPDAHAWLAGEAQTDDRRPD